MTITSFPQITRVESPISGFYNRTCNAVLGVAFMFELAKCVSFDSYWRAYAYDIMRAKLGNVYFS